MSFNLYFDKRTLYFPEFSSSKNKQNFDRNYFDKRTLYFPEFSSSKKKVPSIPPRHDRSIAVPEFSKFQIDNNSTLAINDKALNILKNDIGCDLTDIFNSFLCKERRK